MYQLERRIINPIRGKVEELMLYLHIPGSFASKIIDLP